MFYCIIDACELLYTNSIITDLFYCIIDACELLYTNSIITVNKMTIMFYCKAIMNYLLVSRKKAYNRVSRSVDVTYTITSPVLEHVTVVRSQTIPTCVCLQRAVYRTAKIVIGLYIIMHSFVLPSIVWYAFLNVILLQRPNAISESESVYCYTV